MKSKRKSLKKAAKNKMVKKKMRRSVINTKNLGKNKSFCHKKSLPKKLSAQENEKQSTNACTVSSSGGSTVQCNDSKDVIDKEKLKNLLKVVSNNVRPLANENCKGKKGSGTPIQNARSFEADGAANNGHKKINPAELKWAIKRKMDCVSQKVNNKDNGPINVKKMKICDIGTTERAGNSSGVDVNKLKKLLSKVTESQTNGVSETSVRKEREENKPSKNKHVPLRDRMVERLNAARFRHINERLYNITGYDAQAYFTKEKGDFNVYHEGFQSQVRKWPINPIDLVIKDVLKRSSSLKIADFGCGDAKLARSVPNVVHSYDLIALNEHVVECDIAKVPLATHSVDIVVCCLSLMGTNLVDYLKEANRILKIGGELKVVEIESRINDLKSFVNTLKVIGFSIVRQDTTHKMFIFLDLIKKKNCPRNKLVKCDLHPCVYKKR